MSNAQLALAQQLLSRLHAGGAWYSLWTPNGGPEGNKKRSFYIPIDAPVIVPAAWLISKHVYFVVNPEKTQREQHEAATNENIAAINALYAEFDGPDFTQPTEAEREAALTEIMAESPNKAVTVAMREALKRAKKTKFLTDIPKYKALALAHIQSLTPAPSAIVDSGSGYQCYWLLAQTFFINTEADRDEASRLQAAWVEYVGGDLGAKDLRRVLRLPGTTNRKKHFGDNPPLVHFVKFNLDQVYNLADLAAVLPAPAPTAAKQPTQPTEQPSTAQAPFSGDSVIIAYNAAHNIRTKLLEQGYTDAGGKRMSRPGQPDSAGVELDLTNNRARFWSSNDDMHDPHWKRPFDLFCRFEHDGDVKAAVKAAAQLLGMAYTDKEQPAQVVDPTTGEIIPLADLMEFCRREIARRMAGMKDSQVNVALAIVQIFENAGTTEAPLSDRHLAGLAAVTHQTANHAVKGSVTYRKETLPDDTEKRIPIGRKPNGLEQWLVTKTASGNGILADTYKLSDEMFVSYREKSSTTRIQPSVTSSLWMISRDMLTTIEAHMVDDAFIRNHCKKGVKRSPKALTLAEQSVRLEEMITTQDEQIAHRLTQLMAHGQTENDIKRLDSLSHLMNSAANDNGKRLKSFTTTGLHIIAALACENGQNIDELATRLNKHPAVISAAVKRLALTSIQETAIKPLVRIVEFGTSHRVFLYKTWEARLAAIRPMLHTDGLLKARQIGYADQRIRRIDKILPLVRNEGLKQLYIEIRERTERMIAAIEGKQTAKEAAELLHDEIKRDAERDEFNEWIAERLQAQAQPASMLTTLAPAKVLRFWLGNPTDNTFGHKEIVPALPVTPSYTQSALGGAA